MDNDTQSHATQQYQCPHCQAVMETDAPLEGKQILCPECGESFIALPKSKLRVIRPASMLMPSSPSNGRYPQEKNAHGRGNAGLWFFLSILVLAGLLIGAWFAGVFQHSQPVMADDEPVMAENSVDWENEKLRNEPVEESTPQKEPAAEPSFPVEPTAKSDILAFAPLKAALEAARDNPISANYKKMEEAWSALPDEQKTATQKPVMSAICAMLILMKNTGAAAKRQSLINYRALLDSVTIQCHTCSGAGRNNVQCRTCGGTGIIRRRCESCRLTGMCPSCQGTGGHSQACARCGGDGRYWSSVSRNGGVIYREHTVTCPQCNGKGRRRIACKQCHGSGKCPSCSGHPISEKTCADCHRGTIATICSKCNGLGRIVDRDKCQIVIDDNIGQALRICNGLN